MLYTHSTALWWLEGVGVSVPLHSRTHALLSDNTHTHTHTLTHSHTHTHFKRSDDAQDAHGPSKQTLLDNFIRTSQSLYPPNIICSPVSETHPPSCPESQLLPCVCWLLDLGWRSGAHADCCHLTHSYQWSRRSWRRVPGVRGENRPTRGERTVRKWLMAKTRTPACSRVLIQLDLSEILRCQTKRCTEECGKLSDSVNCSLVCLRLKSTGLKYFHVFKL